MSHRRISLKIRLNKYIAQNTNISRREADELIRMRRVKVNKTIASLGMKIDPSADDVYIDFKHIKPHSQFVYILADKPKNMITSRSDDKHRPTIMDIIPVKYANVKPAGRLDFDSEGLVVMTDDGDFINFLTHPRNRVEKEYRCKIFGRLDEAEIERLKKGIRVEGVKYKFSAIEEIRYLRKTEKSMIRVVLHHGKNREIRNALSALGHPVITLRRVRIGNLREEMLMGKPYKLFSKEDFNKHE